MDMDPPMQSARPYPQDRPYPPAGPGFAPGNPTRGPNFPGNEYPPEQTPYSRAPAPNPAYGGGPGYQQPPLHNNDSAPPGYVRQGNYYVPMPSYETGSSMPSRSEPPNPYGPGYGQPPPNPRNEPRGYGQPDYPNDASRFAYPSPATTVSSVTTRDREPVTIAQQPRCASLQACLRTPSTRLTLAVALLVPWAVLRTTSTADVRIVSRSCPMAHGTDASASSCCKASHRRTTSAGEFRPDHPGTKCIIWTWWLNRAFFLRW